MWQDKTRFASNRCRESLDALGTVFDYLQRQSNYDSEFGLWNFQIGSEDEKLKQFSVGENGVRSRS